MSSETHRALVDVKGMCGKHASPVGKHEGFFLAYEAPCFFFVCLFFQLQMDVGEGKQIRSREKPK